MDQRASAHVWILPLIKGDVGLLHHLRRRPPQDVVWTSRFVIGAWERRREVTAESDPACGHPGRLENM